MLSNERRLAFSPLSFTGLCLGQFGPRPFARPGFGRFGNPNVNLHNSYHRPANNPTSGQNGGMYGSPNSMGGGMGSSGMNPQGLGANMFGGGPGGPGGRMPKGGVCPMLQGVSDMQAFKTSCMMLMQVLFRLSEQIIEVL